MPVQLAPDTRQHLAREVETLTEEFRGVFSHETIERFVDDSLERFSGARFERYIPLLVHRIARERLRALGQAQDSLPLSGEPTRRGDKPRRGPGPRLDL